MSNNKNSNIKKIMFFVVLGSLVTMIGLFNVYMDGLDGIRSIILNN
jgi:hypothetical protein